MERCSNRYARGFIIDKRANSALNFELSTHPSLPPLSLCVNCSWKRGRGGGGNALLAGINARRIGCQSARQTGGRAVIETIRLRIRRVCRARPNELRLPKPKWRVSSAAATMPEAGRVGELIVAAAALALSHRNAQPPRHHPLPSEGSQSPNATPTCELC